MSKLTIQIVKGVAAGYGIRYFTDTSSYILKFFVVNNKFDGIISCIGSIPMLDICPIKNINDIKFAWKISPGGEDADNVKRDYEEMIFDKFHSVQQFIPNVSNQKSKIDIICEKLQKEAELLPPQPDWSSSKQTLLPKKQAYIISVMNDNKITVEEAYKVSEKMRNLSLESPDK